MFVHNINLSYLLIIIHSRTIITTNTTTNMGLFFCT